MTINGLVELAEDSLQKIKAAPLLNFPDYYAQHEGLVEMLASRPAIKDLYNNNGLFFFKNYIGDMLCHTNSRGNALRGYAEVADTDVYARLVRAQLELRLMPNRQPDITAALGQLDPKLWNPYTGKPFEWDKENSTIWMRMAGSGYWTGHPYEHKITVAVPPAQP